MTYATEIIAVIVMAWLLTFGLGYVVGTVRATSDLIYCMPVNDAFDGGR